jgi:broad specificity phosphatase PhoE
VGEGRNCEVNTEEGLIDINFGVWQGLSHKEVKERYREMYKKWQIVPHTMTFPEGESLQEVQKRSITALGTIIKKHPGETVALVSHRVVCKVMLCAILGLDLSRFWYIKQDTCAINMFEHRDGNYYLSLLNDTCHLRRVEGASPLDF